MLVLAQKSRYVSTLQLTYAGDSSLKAIETTSSTAQSRVGRMPHIYCMGTESKNVQKNGSKAREGASNKIYTFLCDGDAGTS